MKIRFISLLTVFAILALSVSTFSTVAFATTDENGFVYSGTTLTGYTGTSSTVTIPSNIVKIGARAFDRSIVTNVTIPQNVRVIDTEAFINSGLTTITFGQNSKLLQISNGAFEGCSFLTSINIPDTVTSFGTGVFLNCSALTTVHLPTAITSIPECTFQSCKALTTVNIPANITSIGNNAFYECKRITSMPIPSTVTSIGESAFRYCEGIEDIDLSANTSLTAIPRLALANMYGLKTVELPDSIETIGKYAFYKDSLLDEITLGNNVTSVGDDAFKYTNANFIIYCHWATVVPEYCENNSLNYQLLDEPLNGFVVEDDKTYYYENGEKVTGWKEIDNQWYYFTLDEGMYTGTKTVGQVEFVFANDGHLTTGSWYTAAQGTRYYYGPSYYSSDNAATLIFVDIDGYTYGFNEDGYRYEGVNIAYVQDGSSLAYEFDADGKYIGLYTGIFNGYYYIDGEVAQGAGLIQIGDDFYFIDDNGEVFVGTIYVTDETANGLIEAGEYEFGEDGKMIIPEIEVKNGIVDGYYYENDQIVKAKGLVYINDDYYYIGMRGQVFKGKVYITEEKANGLVDPGHYEFDEDGKMIMTVKNGIVDGYYYVNNELYYAGMIEIDDDIYYVNSKGKVVTGSYYCSKTNGLMNEGRYQFDEDGKMIVPDANGAIIDGYYYEGTSIVKAKGVVYIDGDYYYIGMRGQVFTGTVFVTEEKANGLVEPSTYVFDEEGKMVTANSGVIVNGHYYVNGEIVKSAGVVQVGGNYYYIGMRGQVFKGRVSINEEKTNGLIPAGTYTFDENGILVE